MADRHGRKRGDGLPAVPEPERQETEGGGSPGPVQLNDGGVAALLRVLAQGRSRPELPKVTTHVFNARLHYEFSPRQLENCVHCGEREERHADGTCLFEATQFEESALRDFFRHFFQNGGELILVSDGAVLHQHIRLKDFDQTKGNLRGEIKTVGVATLEAPSAEKR